MDKRCENYVGITCVDGGCPMALKDEYAERDYDVVHSCDECIYYRGCEDCALAGTEHCVKESDRRGTE